MRVVLALVFAVVIAASLWAASRAAPLTGSANAAQSVEVAQNPDSKSLPVAP